MSLTAICRINTTSAFCLPCLWHERFQGESYYRKNPIFVITKKMHKFTKIHHALTAISVVDSPRDGSTFSFAVFRDVFFFAYAWQT